MQECEKEDRESSYRTESLGTDTRYELTALPPGFRYDVRYCWFVFVEREPDVRGWSFYRWRVMFER